MKASSAEEATQTMEGERKSINPELWLACAGPRVSLPSVGTLVVYFPQGHSEQVAVSTQKDVDGHIPNYPNLPSQLFCQLHNIILHADIETDEVFAQMTLQPVSAVNQDKDLFLSSPDSVSQNRQPNDFFCKTLTNSDTSTHGGFSVPRRAAEKVFPPLDFSKQPPSQELHAKDLHDQVWTFRHIYRGQPKRHLLTTGWSVFVSAKRLVAGDSVLFIRDEKGQLLLGIRRANRQQIVMPSSVLSTDSMHIGVLAAAAHASATSSRFLVFYNPRTSPSEFVVPLAKYNKAVYGAQISVGMRFRMVFEIEDSTLRRYMGTITGINDLDHVRWPSSPWRNLEVGWDESSSGERPRRVSAWEIEPVSSSFLCPPQFPSLMRPKRPWMPPGLLGDEVDLDGSMKRCLTWLRGETNSIGSRGAGEMVGASSPFQSLSADAWMKFQQRVENPSSTQLDFQNIMAGLQDFRTTDASKQLLQQALGRLPHHQQQTILHQQQQNMPHQQQQSVPHQQQNVLHQQLQSVPHQQQNVLHQQQQSVPHQQQNVLHQQQQSVPQQQSVLPQQQQSVPHQQQSVPHQQQQAVPHQQQSVPNQQQQSVPHQQSVPRQQQQSVPHQQQNVLHQQQNVPHQQQKYVTHQQSVPHQQQSVPNQQQQSVPHQQSVPRQQQQSVPHQQQNVLHQQQNVPHQQQKYVTHQHHNVPHQQQQFVPHQQHVPQQQQQSVPHQQQNVSNQQQQNLPHQQQQFVPQQLHQSVPHQQHHQSVSRQQQSVSHQQQSMPHQQQHMSHHHQSTPNKQQQQSIQIPVASSSQIPQLSSSIRPTSSSTFLEPADLQAFSPQSMFSRLNPGNVKLDETSPLNLSNIIRTTQHNLQPSFIASPSSAATATSILPVPREPQQQQLMNSAWFSPPSDPTHTDTPLLSNMQIPQSHASLAATSSPYLIPPELQDTPLAIPATSASLSSRSFSMSKDVHARANSGTMLPSSFPSPSGSFQSSSVSFSSPAASDISMNAGIMASGGLDDALLQRSCSWPPMPAPVRTYTKVQKFGSVGRSLDVSRFQNYEELRYELARMFNLEGQLEDPQRSSWQLVFVDNEGDVLLVGDDPWEEFVSCVRIIRILSPTEVIQMSQQGMELLNTIPMPSCTSEDGHAGGGGVSLDH